ncbi:MAG: hypothetical protein NTV29_07365, partial [Planctomycetota bacterium]|nr:hypothetical protein [Planctomycetota bacterium]
MQVASTGQALPIALLFDEPTVELVSAEAKSLPSSLSRRRPRAYRQACLGGGQEPTVELVSAEAKSLPSSLSRRRPRAYRRACLGGGVTKQLPG